jgi:hypothetical protein
VAVVELGARLVREALHVDRLGEQVAEREHVRERRARAVVPVGDLPEARAARLVVALAAALVAERPDDDGRVVAVALDEHAHVLDVP